MWIMLTTKLPTAPSPPKMGIFWSVPWPHEKYAQGQRQRASDYPDERDVGQSLSRDIVLDPMFGKEPNWARARKIRFSGEDLRIFPHEFSEITTAKLRVYIEGCVVDLVAEGAAEERAVQAVLDGDQRLVYDAALVDGCIPQQAMLVALGQDVSEPDADFPPVGWYRVKTEYATVFCHDWEMAEDRVTEAELLTRRNA